jgi:hypothetical protein
MRALPARGSSFPESVAAELGYTLRQVRRVYHDIDQGRRPTVCLLGRPLLLERVDGPESVEELSTIAAVACLSPDPMDLSGAACGATHTGPSR